MKKNVFFAIMLLMLVSLLSGCADSVSFNDAANVAPVGFWYGVWHGMICPLSFIISLFNDDVAIYAIYNNGAWYDLGFLLGVGILSRGTKTTAREKR